MSDHVAAVRRDVEALEPIDAREAASIATFLAQLDRLANPLDEHADPTHITTSAIVVGARGVLLHRHKRLGIWMQPGGHVDRDEHPADGAVREVAEETGLAVRHLRGARVLHVDVHPAAKGHVHLDLRYLLGGDDRDPTPPPGESPDVRWFGWDEAMAIADPGLIGALRRVCNDDALRGSAGAE